MEKNNKNPNVPNLRFSEFSGEWEIKRLDECASFLDEQRKPIKSTERSSEFKLYPYYGASGVIDYIDDYIFDEELILLSEDGANILDRNYRVAFIVTGKTWVNNHAHVLRPVKDVDISYLSEYLESLRYEKYNTGSTMPKLNQEVCRGIRVWTPKYDEQKKIGRLLSAINERIETQKKIIEKYESLIRGLCENLTRQGTANKTICECLECNSSTRQESSVLEDGRYPVYGATGVCGYTEAPDVTGEGILIIKDGASVGATSYAEGSYSAIGTLNRLTAKQGINLRYVYYCLKVMNFAPYKTGLAIPPIYFKDYGKHKIWCPSFEQQSSIVAVLTKIDNKIQIEKSLLECLNSQKRYMLNQMFI